jgi:hypothetical protein
MENNGLESQSEFERISGGLFVTSELTESNYMNISITNLSCKNNYALYSPCIHIFKIIELEESITKDISISGSEFTGNVGYYSSLMFANDGYFAVRFTDNTAEDNIIESSGSLLVLEDMLSFTVEESDLKENSCSEVGDFDSSSLFVLASSFKLHSLSAILIQNNSFSCVESECIDEEEEEHDEEEHDEDEEEEEEHHHDDFTKNSAFHFEDLNTVTFINNQLSHCHGSQRGIIKYHL